MAFGSLGSAIVTLHADLKPLMAGFARARSELTSLVGFANTAAASFATITGGMLVGGFVASARAASDLNEQLSKIHFVFGDAAKVITASADEMADRLGVARTTFIEGAAAIGQLGKAAGLTREKAAEMGVAFTKIAIDAASLNNIPLDVALTKIRAGLVGQIRPLRELGVLLSMDAVKLEAFESGLDEDGKKLDEQTKLLSRANLIMKGFADATGDLNRTQGALANRLREVWGRAQNLAAAFGEHLLPVAKELVGIGIDMAKSFENMLKDNVVFVDLLGRGLRTAVLWVRELVGSKELLGNLFKAIGAEWQSVFAELFRVLTHNFFELARYFGETLAKSIWDSLSGSPLARGLLGFAAGGVGGPAAPKPPDLRGFQMPAGIAGGLDAVAAAVERKLADERAAKAAEQAADAMVKLAAAAVAEAGREKGFAIGGLGIGGAAMGMPGAMGVAAALGNVFGQLGAQLGAAIKVDEMKHEKGGTITGVEEYFKMIQTAGGDAQKNIEKHTEKAAQLLQKILDQGAKEAKKGAGAIAVLPA